MEVTFLRHAQSIFNRDLTSEKNCELTDVGIRQAEQLTGTYDIIICSLLKRTRQTLLHSQFLSKQLHFTDLCREVRRDICDFLEEENEQDLETHASVEKRIREFIQFLQSKGNPGDRILVISHRDFIDEITGKRFPPLENAKSITVRLE